MAPATSAQVAAAARASINIRSIPSNLTPSVAQVSSQQGYWAALSTTYIKNSCNAWDTPALQMAPTACLYGDVTSRRTVVLYGDSNAANWAPALDNAFRAAKIRLALVAMPGCDSGFMAYTIHQTAYPQACEKWHAHLAHLARSLKPEAVLLVSSGSVWPTPVGWTVAIERAFSVLTSGNSAVRRVIVGTSPNFSSVPECLTAYPTNVQHCSVEYSSPVSEYAEVLARDTTLAVAAKARLVPVDRWMCYAHRCSPIIGRMMAVVDDNHTSIVFSEWLAGVFQSALTRLI